MSQISIRSALETQLNTLTPKIATQFENVAFTPVTGIPYQSAYLMMNTPEDTTVADSIMYREKGIFQITLRYPLGKGTIAIMTQAEKIREAFKIGTLLSKDGRRIVCDKTPDIRVLPNEVDRFVVVVRVFFTADIFNLID
jgi:hypothetical protein